METTKQVWTRPAVQCKKIFAFHELAFCLTVKKRVGKFNSSRSAEIRERFGTVVPQVSAKVLVMCCVDHPYSGEGVVYKMFLSILNLLCADYNVYLSTRDRLAFQ